MTAGGATRAGEPVAIRAIVSDFGGVLTTPLERSFQAWSDAQDVPLARLGAAMATVTRRDGANPLHELEVGRISEAAFLERLAGALSEALGRDVDMRAFAEGYFAHLEPNTELLERLRVWRDGGLRLALCTNNVREWEPRWRAMLPVDELFETVVDSAWVGVRKPDRGIYEIVLERLDDVPAQTCLFLDDVAHNCDAAREIGMRTVHFRDTAQAIGEIEAALGEQPPSGAGG